MDKLNEHIEFLEMTESDPQLLVWLLELRRHRQDQDNWKQRAEAAEALNKHLELAVRKAEGVSETLRRRAEAAESALTEKPQPVAVVVGKLGAGIRATAFEAAPRPDLGQLLYDGPAAPVKLPVSQRLDGNGYGYYFDMNDVFTALEDAGIKFEVQK